jgi:hypothetical protein
MSINRGRVFLGGIAGGVVWVFWSWAVGQFIIGNSRYTAAQNTGQFLKTARYSFFTGQWIFTLFVVAIILAYIYACVRQTLGSGPMTALKIGFLAGFIAGFPLNFAQAAWVPIDRMFPLGWMLDMWAGCILATLVAAWLYKE